MADGQPLALDTRTTTGSIVSPSKWRCPVSKSQNILEWGLTIIYWQSVKPPRAVRETRSSENNWSTPHGPHRKWRFQLLFVAARTSCPSFYLTTIGEYIQTYEGWWKGFMKYAAQMGSGAIVCKHSFITSCSDIRKCEGGGGENSQTHRQQVDPISLIFTSFEIGEVGQNGQESRGTRNQAWLCWECQNPFSSQPVQWPVLLQISIFPVQGLLGLDSFFSPRESLQSCPVWAPASS
jgi:hypothetical protein